MRYLFLVLALFIAGCEDRRQEVSHDMYEEAVVKALKNDPAHTHSGIRPTLGFDGKMHLSSYTDHDPEEWHITFTCQHGDFTVGGSYDRYKTIYHRFKVDDKVMVSYREISINTYEKKVMTKREFHKFDFLDAWTLEEFNKRISNATPEVRN